MNNRQTKFTSEKKAVISLILGIVSTAPLLLILFAIVIGTILSAHHPIYIYGDFLITLLNYAGAPSTIIIAFVSGVIGLILGIMGLKSTKKKFAIGGIIFSLIGLGVFILRLWIYKGIVY